ncbi:MAG: hypothetical protein ACXQS8_02950, partial [Candidatus Helarchaeales archaeon]
ILLMDKEYSRVSFILYESPSPEFREKARAFLEDVEQEYGVILKDFDGSMKPFSTLYLKTAKYLDTDYAKPHTLVDLTERQKKMLSDIQLGIIHISTRQLEKKKMIRLASVMDTLKSARTEPDYELYAALYDLLEAKVLVLLGEEEIKTSTLETQIDEVARTETSEQPPETTQVSPEPSTGVQGLREGEVVALGLPEDAEQQVQEELQKMSPTARQLFLNMFNGTPNDRKKKFLKDFLKDRKNIRKNLEKMKKNLEKLKKKGNKDEIFYTLEDIKVAYEELGEEEEATKLATEIQEFLTTFDSVKELKELRLKSATTEKQAEWHASKRDFLRSALYYRKAARLALELGNVDEATRLAEKASEMEARE